MSEQRPPYVTGNGHSSSVHDGPDILEETEALDPRVAYALALLEAERADLRSQLLQHRESMAQQRLATSGKADREGLWDTADNRTRKQGLYNLWKQSTILGAAADVIAKRFVSGEWHVVPRRTKGMPRAGSPPVGAIKTKSRVS